MSDAVGRSHSPPTAPGAGVTPATPETPDPPVRASGLSRRAMATNIASNWAWSLLVIISGFLLPRMIDDHLGRHALGIWDLCWSLSVYVELLSLGIVSAVGRYVARLRTTGEWDRLNDVVNTSLAMLSTSCAIAVTLIVSINWVYWLTPPDERDQVGDLGRWLSLFLVGAAALQLPAGVYNGILTGWERFDLLNSLRITRDLFSVTLMVSALYAGFGLIVVGAICFGLAVLLSVAKWWMARRLFVQMRHSRRHVRPEIARDLLSFGGKSVLQEFARGGLMQASTLVVSRVMGAEAVALFSRQRNLIVQAYRFIKQYSQVFVPRTATLQAQSDEEGLRRMFVQSTFGGFCIALPLLLGLAIAGGDLVQLWMGADYRAPALLATLAIGQILPLGQLSTISILMGLGKHGRAAVVESVLTLGGILMMIVWTGFLDGGMLSAAVTIGLCLSVGAGTLVPWLTCRLLTLNFGRYLRDSLVRPTLAVAPFVLTLIAIQLFGRSPGSRLVLSGLLGAPVLFTTYFFTVLPIPIRERVLRRLGIKQAADAKGRSQ